MTEKRQPPQDIRKTFPKGEKYYKEIALFTITIPDTTLRTRAADLLIKVEDDTERGAMMKALELLLNYNEEQLLSAAEKIAYLDKAAAKVYSIKNEEHKKEFLELAQDLAYYRLKKMSPGLPRL